MRRNSFIPEQGSRNLCWNFPLLSHLTSMCSNNSKWSESAFSRCARNSRLWRYLARTEQRIFIATSILSLMFIIIAHNACWCIIYWELKKSRRASYSAQSNRSIRRATSEGVPSVVTDTNWHTGSCVFSIKLWKAEKCPLPACVSLSVVLLTAPLFQSHL